MIIYVVGLLLNTILIQGSLVPKNNLKEIALDEKGFDNVKNLHFNWYLFSIKALLAQLGKEFMRAATPDQSFYFLECLSKIEDVKEIERSAVCLLEAKRLSKEEFISPQSAFIQEFKKRRRKRSPYRLVESRRRRKFRIRNMSSAPSLSTPYRSPAARITNLFNSIFSNNDGTKIKKSWKSVYKRMASLLTNLERKESSEAASVYNLRMHDIITGKKADDVGSGNNLDDYFNNMFRITKKSEGLTATILSPRIAPLLPRRERRRGFLSPALFPMYKDDQEEQILPIPEVLDKSGLAKKDKESVMEMIMELSGARSTVQEAMKILGILDNYGVADGVLSATESISKSFAGLRKTFSQKQRDSLEKRGFALLNSRQMKRIHKKNGLTKDKEMQMQYDLIDSENTEEALWLTVEEIASGYKKNSRTKRQSTIFGIIPGSLLAPFVLSPYMFAPVYGLTVLGPVVLSPNIFSPLILNPSLLSPWVLSPAFPLPFIISPYVLSPYVLSPLVMAPFVLTPYVLSPNVINPYVLSPLILSPLVLCPDLLSPMVLGGPILSPAVLSPSVLSKSAVMAVILSPSVLS